MERSETGVAPGWVWGLGLGGLIPFYALGAAMIALEGPLAAAAFSAYAIYAAVILSFLGGVRWGLEMARAPTAPKALTLAGSVLGAIAGWVLASEAILIGAREPAASLFAALFALHYLWNRAAVSAGTAPAWYGRLRLILTAGVMISALAIPLARLAGRI